MPWPRRFFLPRVIFAFTFLVADMRIDRKQSGEGGQANTWAVLVAGSKTYTDYRHQADICHAYHVLSNHGVSDEHIVVMMYDNIADHPENPTPGFIRNHPEGPNVYQGVPKDYTGDLVTPENFLRILQGKNVNRGSGKFIASGPNDHIFVVFSGHGAPDLLTFPAGSLAAGELINVITEMSREGKFSKMVLYIEACYSGSMFEGLLPDNINVYATTAANPNENSYACYYDLSRNVYLGDEYSVRWMEHSDRSNLRKTTLNEQYIYVRNKTKASNVVFYGDPRLMYFRLSEFQGMKEAKQIVRQHYPCSRIKSQDVPTSVLSNKIAMTTDLTARKDLQQELNKIINKRTSLNKKVAKIVEFLARRIANSSMPFRSSIRPVKNFECYKKAVDYFDDHCFKLSEDPYGLTHLYVLRDACEIGCPLAELTYIMDAACSDSNISRLL